jgi:outer membrane receptor protein involved in Fe transport
MANRLSLGAILLLSTALTTPALAQQAEPPAAETETTPPTEEPTTEVPQEEVDVSSSGTNLGNEIVVTGRFIPNPVRATPEVITVLSSAEIARAGDGDVAGALTRVTGLSVVGSGFVYVRGLGDRYSLALLNGSPLPSPEPLKRVVPLDIFPTNILASVVVQKSFSPNFPGEFGGGVINLTTKAIPEDDFFEAGASISGDTETTGHFGYTHFGDRSDWTGFDGGARSIPAPLKAALGSGSLIAPGATFSNDALETIGISLTNSATSVVQRTKNIRPNFSGDLSWGNSFEAGDTRLGVIATLSYSNSWRTRDAIQQFSAGTVLTTDVNFNSVRTDNQILLNGMLALGAEFGEHKVRLTNLIIRDTLKLSRLSRGTDVIASSADQEIIKQETAWYERQLINSQFVGEFEFGDLDLDVRGSYANSKRDAPYERSFSYAFNDTVQAFTNDLRSVNQSARISFSELEENVYSGAIDLAYKLPTAIPFSVSLGYAYTDTQRTSSRRDFRFLPDGTLNLAVAQQRPDFLLSDFNIQTYNIFITETSGQSGAAAFDAGLKVHAGYFQAEAEVVDSVRISAGVRYEDGKQFVAPINLFNSSDLTFLTPTRIANSYWLPAATVTWNFKEDMQLRAHASKTVARPQFRELARQVYQDTDADRQFFGNPFLKDSKLFNAEARYEWYYARGQRLTAAAFYKKIDNPIEVFAFIPSGSLVASFANAPSAKLYGFEVDAVKHFPFDGAEGFLSTRQIVVAANYTYSKSKISIGASDTIILPFGATGEVRAASDFFNGGAPLTGQSDHLINLQVGLEDTEGLSQQTFLLTYASERVTNRGAQGQPDIIERPGLRLDFVARQAVSLFGKEVNFKFEARNILGTDYKEFQNDGTNRIDINSYALGTSISLGASIKF